MVAWIQGISNADFCQYLGSQSIDGAKKLVFQIIEGTGEVYDFQTNLKQQFTWGPEFKIAKCPYAQVVCSNGSKILVVTDVDGELRMLNLQI